MMKRYRWFLPVAVIAVFTAGACAGQNTAPTVDVNAAVQTAIAATRAIDTQVAQAVQATLQAVTPAPPPAATDTAIPAPADTPLPAPTETPLPAPTDAAAPPPANTPTRAPAPTKPPTPAPTPTRIRIAESDVDGNDGNDFLRSSSNSNQGRVVLLPGLDQAEVGDLPTFSDFINLRVEVFDTRAGLVDGAGIESVTFSITEDNGNGEPVYEKRETSPAFCLFGGDEPTCGPLNLSTSQRWPNGVDINNGTYLATIDIVPQQGDATVWRWRFAVESPYLAGITPPGAANTARIDAIAVQDGRYIVDFETIGYTPVLPGQHVHFFFDTVPLDQAGTPGSGPWQIYPAGPNQPNTSPFTLLTVDDRPSGATQMCILVANPDHSVIQGTGNCVDLPGS